MQKAPGNTQRGNTDPKTQKRPEATQGVNSNPNTPKVPEVIQGGEPRKPENSRARRRRESQLITAAPLESATSRWTPPRERAGYVNLKAPRTSYGPRGGRVARREKRELEQPRIVQKLGEGYPILRRTRTDLFFKPPQAMVALVPKVGSPGEHRVAVAVEPLRAWGSSVVRCQKKCSLWFRESLRCAAPIRIRR